MLINKKIKADKFIKFELAKDLYFLNLTDYMSSLPAPVILTYICFFGLHMVYTKFVPYIVTT